MGAEVTAAAGAAMDVASVHSLIQAQRFGEIAAFCDSLELECASRGTVPEDWPYTIHLLGHIFNSDMNSARFLWKRIPPTVKQSQPELAQAWKIGQCMWARNYAAVHEALRGYDWSPDVKQLVAAVSDYFSRKTFKLLSTAYASLSIGDAAAFLGLPESETIAYVEQQGWVLDPNTQMFKVVPCAPVHQNLDTSNLQNLTEYVFHLEH